MNQKPRLVAGLICGNEAERIERCVRSLQKICDDVVIIRAVGALEPDATLDIAKSLGCHVGEYRNSPLCRHWEHLDDFAAARNVAFEKAYDLAGEGGWVMWADCDDVLQDNMVEPTLKALRDCPAECDWILSDYVIPEQHKRAPRERFFRYRTGYWWRAVHENLHPTKTIKIYMRRDLEIHHMPPLGQRKSNERNQRILEWQDQFAPHWKFYLHYEKMITGQRDLALRYGAEALAMKDFDLVNKYETLMNMSNMTDGASALRFAQSARKLDPARREAVALEASILLDDGKPEEALAILDDMEKIPVPAFTQWTHKAEYYGVKARRLRAWALRLAGRKEEAFNLEMEVLNAAPRPRISLLHATRGRPLQAVQNMNVWLSRANKPERVEHIFAVDSDDKTAAVLQRFCGVCQDADDGSVGAWNLAASVSTGDILIQFSDDFECPPGWDDMIESRLDISSEKVLRISDGYRTDELLPMAICTRKFYDKHGLFHPDFKNQFSDAEFTIRAEKAGAIVDARDIVFVHHHPAFEPIPTDATHERCSDPIERERAKKIFESLTKNITNP
jgi:glycosyltransferase involved in cell wall biosynthesis